MPSAMNTPKIAVIDFLALSDVKGFVIKELAIKKAGLVCHIIPRKPVDLVESPRTRRQNAWLTRHYHAMTMDHDKDGYVYEDLPELIMTLTADVDYLYCKGLEKCKFLETFIARRVIDINDYDCSTLIKCHCQCDFHCTADGRYKCSLSACQDNYSFMMGQLCPPAMRLIVSL